LWQTEPGTETPPSSPEVAVLDEPPKKPLKILAVDLNIEENAEQHHTDEYEVTQGEGGAKKELVLRRGQAFSFHIHLDRHYERRNDDINIIFKTGAEIGVLICRPI
jgi:hypothetical protein